MSFDGSALYQRRLKKDMSRADLAHAIRRSSQGQIRATERGIRGWEKGEYMPRADAVSALAVALDCEMGDFYTSNGTAASDEDDEESSMPLSREEQDVLVALFARLASRQVRS